MASRKPIATKVITKTEVNPINFDWGIFSFHRLWQMVFETK